MPHTSATKRRCDVAKKSDRKKVGEIITKVRELGLSYKDGAKKFGIKPWLLYDYNRKANSDARAAVAAATAEPAEAEAPKETAASPVGLPGAVEELILTYRREHPSHGFKRIQDLLKQKHLVVVTRKQIRRVLKEAGLLGSCDSSFDREATKAKGTRRFEAAYPGEIWQMDVTYVYISRIPVLYLVVIVDDHSRYCVAAELVRDQRAETLIAVLHDAVTEYGAPQKLLTDQGSGFYSWSREQTRFQEYLDDQKIEHVVSEPHSPQTQGKVERLIQTTRDELLSRVKFTGFEDAREQIRSYVRSYNVDRPHQGIGGSRPADRFHGVAGEVDRVEAQLSGREVDPERGYVIYKFQEHRVCVCTRAKGLQVYLDGKLLKEADGDGSQR
ncbi:MAG: transposase [Planctomycetes bacterium]|nr:transposase [Planctomycetota bacterium]